MEGEIRLGRLAGFPFAVSWTVVVIAGVITWGTSTAILPQYAPGETTAAYWLTGVLASVLFLASLTAHELMHAVLARRAGMEVLGLTLWLFGGVATLRGEPPTPRDDLRIAAVGPLTSLALGAGFGVASGGLDAAGGPALAVAVAQWLALVNVVLGLFNLLPGAPLDGGRVLRAFLWKRLGDRAEAGVRASRAGERTGIALVVLGLLEIMGGADLGGLWMAFIGWFVLGAAKQEEQATRMLQAFAGLTVADVMTPSPAVVPAELPVEELAARLPWRAHAAYPVVARDGSVTGVLHLSAVASALDAGGGVRAGELAVPLDDGTSARSDEALPDVVARTAPAGDGRVVVVDDGELVGIVTPSDLNRLLRLHEVAGSAVRRPRSHPPANAA